MQILMCSPWKNGVIGVWLFACTVYWDVLLYVYDEYMEHILKGVNYVMAALFGLETVTLGFRVVAA